MAGVEMSKTCTTSKRKHAYYGTTAGVEMSKTCTTSKRKHAYYGTTFSVYIGHRIFAIAIVLNNEVTLT